MRRQLARLPDGMPAARAAAAAALVGRASPAPADLGAGAFFDVDNTIMRGASIYHFARGLAARKMFTSVDLAKMTWAARFRCGSAAPSTPGTWERPAERARVRGRARVSDIVALCEEIYDETMADRIWEGTRELAQRHLDAGQRVWLVTATPMELAEIAAAGSA